MEQEAREKRYIDAFVTLKESIKRIIHTVAESTLKDPAVKTAIFSIREEGASEEDNGYEFVNGWKREVLDFIRVQESKILTPELRVPLTGISVEICILPADIPSDIPLLRVTGYSYGSEFRPLLDSLRDAVKVIYKITVEYSGGDGVKTVLADEDSVILCKD